MGAEGMAEDLSGGRREEEALAADEANCLEDNPERVECGALMADFGRAG